MHVLMMEMVRVGMALANLNVLGGTSYFAAI
jgi:hypothetical protein